MKPAVSVIIPLYNKAAEIGATLRSVLGQTVQPLEIIVVDDGSTDGGAEVVKAFAEPLVRLVGQPNRGVAAARNRGIAEARGEYVALLDGDDVWEPRFLEKSIEMIEKYPECAIYATGFYTLRKGKKFPAASSEKEGVLDDFFCEAMRGYICTSSSVVIPKDIFQRSGGFPEGMKIGEDLYCWIGLASLGPVCFTPELLAGYVITASNRSVCGYTPENTIYSFRDLYRPEEENSCRNEYIARCAIGKGIILSSRGDTRFGLETERFFSYTRMYRRELRKLRILNRLPASLRPFAHNTYQRLAWLIARKGF